MPKFLQIKTHNVCPLTFWISQGHKLTLCSSCLAFWFETIQGKGGRRASCRNACWMRKRVGNGELKTRLTR